MKKFFCIALIVVLCICCSACGGGEFTNDTSNRLDTSGVKHTGKKIDGEIIAASDFSEGLAFVELSKDKGKTYCINKDGNIVFDLDIDLSINGDIYATFINGLAYVNEGFCDTSGKVIKPADVGATNFKYVTLSAGYIIAEVITSDYSDTNKKLGVLNTKFEWTVEPSENLYNEFADEYGYIQIDNAINTPDYTDGDLYHNDALKKTLNLKTGEIIKDEEKTGTPNSSVWVLGYGDRRYTGYFLPDESTHLSEDKLILDLTKNGVVYSATSFVNGKAAIVYHNADANKYYVTMIDETGKHLFEPVETKCRSVQTDGKYILVTDASVGTADYAEVFNEKGEKTGEKDVSEDTSMSYNFYLSDGVVLVRAGILSMTTGYRGKAFYLDSNCNDLF